MNRLEIYGIALLVLLAVIAGAYFKGHHAGYESAKDDFAAAALKAEQAQRDKLLEVSTNYEQQLSQVKIDAANRPARVVRLCQPAVQNATAPGESQPSPATQSDSTPGRDIGREIYNYADDFKACAIQVNSLLDAWPH